MTRARNVQKEYDLPEYEQVTSKGPGGVLVAEMEMSLGAKELEDLVYKAEARGREAGRRELINAITDMTTKEIRGAAIDQMVVNIGYNFKDNSIFRAVGMKENFFFAKDPEMIGMPDEELSLIPEEARVEKPEFLKDAEKVKNMTLGEIHASLKIGWYQSDTTLRYWDGTGWKDNPGKAARMYSSMPLEQIAEMEYLG